MSIQQIQQNIASRKQVEQLFETMLDLVRDDFRKLAREQKKRFLELAHERFADRLDLPCCAKNTPLRQPPTRPAADTTTDWDEAISELQEIVELCGSVPDRGRDFADSVAESAISMIGTIERNGKVTLDQVRAIRNWYDGVMAWVER